MLLALLSDTHDNIASTRAALDILRPHHPAAYLHAGDIVSPAHLDHFANLRAPFHFVLGNNEFDIPALRAAALAHGLLFHGNAASLTLDNLRIALLHGHELARMNAIIHAGEHDILIHGHTHLRRDDTLTTPHPLRIINPGALHRAKEKSVALFNTQSRTLHFLAVPTGTPLPPPRPTPG